MVLLLLGLDSVDCQQQNLRGTLMKSRCDFSSRTISFAEPQPNAPKRVRFGRLMGCGIVVVLLLVIFPLAAAQGQKDWDEFRDGPGLEIVKCQVGVSDEVNTRKSEDRIILKVKNSGERAITSFSYDFVAFDQNRTDTISDAETFTIKKTIKPGETKEVSSRVEHLDRSNPNNMVRIVKITYDNGESWDRFQK